MRNASRAVLVLFVFVATAVFAACGSSDQTTGANATAESTAAKPANGPESASMGGKVPTIVIRGGEPVGGIEELEYDAGDEIRFEVTSDVADEVHVHGYDLMQDVSAGDTVSFDFPAEIEGIFEVELEGRREQIAELRVNP
jgi:plastocyanin